MASPGRKLIKRDELIGKDVYDFNARKVGSITDIAFSEDARPMLMLAKPDKSEETIPLESVDRLGDIVLLKRDVVPVAASAQNSKSDSPGSAPGSGRICIKCGAVNPLTTRFCIQCRNQFY